MFITGTWLNNNCNNKILTLAFIPAFIDQALWITIHRVILAPDREPFVSNLYSTCYLY